MVNYLPVKTLNKAGFIHSFSSLIKLLLPSPYSISVGSKTECRGCGTNCSGWVWPQAVVPVFSTLAFENCGPGNLVPALLIRNCWWGWGGTEAEFVILSSSPGRGKRQPKSFRCCVHPSTALPSKRPGQPPGLQGLNSATQLRTKLPPATLALGRC
jgi:hypothetical protein